ncbi:MAG: type III-B CRISPR module RAMP protein Cmr4 [Chloracidobacterium sp.]|uniref:Type III-B CRISPR module RAMP protein Cmr4 n=1 Tax=Chloracidobacterium validum TaxID=2821543 RepID=A0ABX8B6A6_9BACT|nr:type III-B CRISPR module RAMP protein Cmr4 [Chloracidobacterium validum]QUW02499.1 type III-B CRISPR module RAMP protein Cmr4 [Chloracidobacterium validum]
MSNIRLYWLHTLSPTHAGIGRGVGYIDLPVDRDGITGWPILRGSSFKGVWRDWAVQQGKQHIELAFGRADKDGEAANAGALIPTDAKLVCLPVRSFRGTLAWTTSPLCLQMLRRTLDLAGVKDLPEVPTSLPDDRAHHAKNSALPEDNNIYLEDLDFTAQACDLATQWAENIGQWVFGKHDSWAEVFQKRFVVLPDTAFDFLCETGTEVHTRVRIDDETKTVAKGALWTEESLPAETILMGLIQCERIYKSNGFRDDSLSPEQLLADFATEPLTLQIGGKATVGRGQVRVVFTGGMKG